MKGGQIGLLLTNRRSEKLIASNLDMFLRAVGHILLVRCDKSQRGGSEESMEDIHRWSGYPDLPEKQV
jgi:hypothetical protein